MVHVSEHIRFNTFLTAIVHPSSIPRREEVCTCLSVRTSFELLAAHQFAELAFVDVSRNQDILMRHFRVVRPMSAANEELLPFLWSLTVLSYLWTTLTRLSACVVTGAVPFLVDGCTPESTKYSH